MRYHPPFVAFLASVSGCGSVSNIVSCAQTLTSSAQGSVASTSRYQCVDYGSTDPSFLDSVAATCVSGPLGMNGIYTDAVVSTLSSGGCTHANSIGGCLAMDGTFTSIAWFYPQPGDGTPLTSTTLPGACTAWGETYVAP